MNEAFRVFMSELGIPLLALALVVAAIVVVTWHFSRPKPSGQHSAPGPYAPRVAAGTCQRCGAACDGYDMSISGLPARIHWQHREPPADMHLAVIATAYVEPGQPVDLSELPTVTDPWPQETATPIGQHRAEAGS